MNHKSHTLLHGIRRYIAALLMVSAMCMVNASNVAMTDDDDDFGPWEVLKTDTINIKSNATDSIAYDLSIMGEATISAKQLTAFVRTHNADFDAAIADAFIAVGERYGVRGDIALLQSIVETGWFRFDDGTAVTPEQHNYCGLGVLRRGLRGHSFESIEQGVTAQIQHLYAYACRDALPKGESLIDPRFKYVQRGVATTWMALSNRWAANARYGRQILDLYHRALTGGDN